MGDILSTLGMIFFACILFGGLLICVQMLADHKQCRRQAQPITNQQRVHWLIEDGMPNALAEYLLHHSPGAFNDDDAPAPDDDVYARAAADLLAYAEQLAQEIT